MGWGVGRTRKTITPLYGWVWELPPNTITTSWWVGVWVQHERPLLQLYGWVGEWVKHKRPLLFNYFYNNVLGRVYLP